MDTREAFKTAVERGDAGGVRTIFAEDPELADEVDAPWFAFDSPAIVHAAGLKHGALIDALLDVGADVDARSAWENGPYTALHRLVDGQTEESLALAEHLLARGATLDLPRQASAGQESWRRCSTGRPDGSASRGRMGPHRCTWPGIGRRRPFCSHAAPSWTSAA